MAKKQTRRTVSFNRDRYEALRIACEEDKIAMSAFVDEAVRERLERRAEVRISTAAPPPSAIDGTTAAA